MNLQAAPKNLINTVCQFPEEHKNKIVKMALVASQPNAHDKSRIIESFSNDSNIPKQQIYEVLGVYIAIVHLFLESNDNDFNTRLLEIGFTPEFVEKLPFIGNRDEIVKNLLNNFNTDYAKLASLKWKLDISLSNSLVVRKIPASVILIITLKNSSKYTIEVEAKTFHKLRFSVALILKELHMLQSSMLNK
ncbi:hypothetical protein NQ317_006240 [Molorchus minor]|uniref:COMM domain-containing protein 5 n=1 Tax=Molorchus minor TaxID=1323400 RepID=A0ABQ9K5H9_9CUCU|nr:hypothetical protein NQ317_006240 [Molorchus minor]